ncbi:MAG: oxygenase MpaB family protein [Acidobacteriota bacterium]|nr:oxygenase MpaB family protein [Acidobacteriota bacterium]
MTAMPADEAIPSSYRDGYREARARDAETADTYIVHTTIGDPPADRVVEDLARDFEPAQAAAILAAAIQNPGDLPEKAPHSLHELVEQVSVLPNWYDAEVALAATKAFLRNSEMVLAGLVGAAIVEGFSTLISKSFRIRGRIMGNGVRRLKQNLIQLVEQFLPGGMEPGGDGWRLTLRIRLVHAQSRMLLKDLAEWNSPTHGVPISAAHLLLASAAFSGRLMRHVQALGGDFSAEERDAYVHVWRYTGIVMGVPEQIMFHDMQSSLRAFDTAAQCEPAPDLDAIIMANSIVNSAPLLLGFTETEERRAKAKYIYSVSRSLIGNDLADKLNYPPPKKIKDLPLLRLKNRLERALQQIRPGWGSRLMRTKFTAMLDVSALDEFGPSFALPTSVHDEDSEEW